MAFSFYFATVFIEVMLDLTLTNILTVPAFILSGQYWEQEWRLYYFMLIVTLLAMTSSSLGLVVSVLFMESPAVAILAGISVGMISQLYSGSYKFYS